MKINKKIFVLGDIMLDIYQFGEVIRISPEAPVPVFHEVEKGIRYAPGGAANVACNLAEIGAEVTVFSFTGDDQNGDILKSILKEKNIRIDEIIKLENHVTTTKLRYMGQNHQQILRVDREEIIESDVYLSEEILHQLGDKITSDSVVILSDYQKGFLSERLCRYIIDYAKKKEILVLADIKGKNEKKYYGADILKPNRLELALISGMPVATKDQVIRAAMSLCRKAECRYVLTTLGAEGMILSDINGMVRHIKSVAKEVYDVTGAGDTVLAYLAAGLAKGLSIEEAMELSNYAASVQVSKIGTSTVSFKEVEQIRQLDGTRRNKVLNAYQPNGFAALWRRKEKGQKIVFSNGCFDILHTGHVEYLRKARALGDCLVIAVNSDASVKRLKGKERPVNSLEDRVMLLTALEFVDYVVAFEEDTPVGIIKAIQPDILVKGGDYRIEEIAGHNIVSENGGDVVIIPFVNGKSTTELIEKLRK